MSNPVHSRVWNSASTWIALGFGSVALWTFFGQWQVWRSILVVSLSLSSFTIGCLAGFLFTSYGEETATVGKVRDWLVGGLTGITIVKVGSIKAVLETFVAGPGPTEFALVVAVAVIYLGIGFFFMFFQRELILNVLLAERRAERGRVDGTIQAGIVTQRFLTALSPSLLSGIDDINEIVKGDKEEADKLRTALYSAEVSKFLEQAEEATKSGSRLDWDIVSKAANLHYYRTYFETGGAKDTQECRAEEWLMRALIMNPHHVDLNAKYADVLGMMEVYSEAVTVLERLNASPEGPAYIQQWLGYFLLFVPGREDDAIRFSEEYRKRFVDDSDPLFNIACGYAQKYERELQDAGVVEKRNSENRANALKYLSEALLEDPQYGETVRTKWVKPGESFASLAGDPEFQKITLDPAMLRSAKAEGETERVVAGAHS